MLKRATILTLMAVLAAFPALCWAQGGDLNNFPTGNVSSSVQAYGDQTATYQTGCVQIDTYEKGTVDKVEVVVTGKYTSIGNQSSVPCSTCGGDLTQGGFESTRTTTMTASEYTAVSKATYLVGNAQMTSTGGMSLCSTPGIAAEGTLSQSHTVSQTAGGSLAPGVQSSASYTGTQSFTATIKSQ